MSSQHISQEQIAAALERMFEEQHLDRANFGTTSPLQILRDARKLGTLTPDEQRELEKIEKAIENASKNVFDWFEKMFSDGDPTAHDKGIAAEHIAKKLGQIDPETLLKLVELLIPDEKKRASVLSGLASTDKRQRDAALETVVRAFLDSSDNMQVMLEAASYLSADSTTSAELRGTFQEILSRLGRIEASIKALFRSFEARLEAGRRTNSDDTESGSLDWRPLANIGDKPIRSETPNLLLKDVRDDYEQHNHVVDHQERIEELENEIAELQAELAPLENLLSCAEGEDVSFTRMKACTIRAEIIYRDTERRQLLDRMRWEHTVH